MSLGGTALATDFALLIVAAAVLSYAASLTEQPTLVVEDNPVLFEEIRNECDNYLYGDVSNERVWELARLEDAALVVSLTPEHDRSEAVVDLDADVPRVVRVDSTETADEFLDRGATGVIYPDTIAAERVGADLEALLEDDISREEFVERGRGHFETPGDG